MYKGEIKVQVRFIIGTTRKKSESSDVSQRLVLVMHVLTILKHGTNKSQTKQSFLG